MTTGGFLVGYAATLGVMSGVTFAAFAWDKRCARKGRWRVSERTLHVLEALGGWPGGWLGRRMLRHKSSKRSFRLMSGLIVVGHGVGVAAVMWMLADFA